MTENGKPNELPDRWGATADLSQGYPMAWVMIDAPRVEWLEDPRGARVRAIDTGGGVCVGVEFFNDDPIEGEKITEGYFYSAGEIDRFASTLKDLLRAAQETSQ